MIVKFTNKPEFLEVVSEDGSKLEYASIGLKNYPEIIMVTVKRMEA